MAIILASDGRPHPVGRGNKVTPCAREWGKGVRGEGVPRTREIALQANDSWWVDYVVGG